MDCYNQVLWQALNTIYWKNPFLVHELVRPLNIKPKITFQIFNNYGNQQSFFTLYNTILGTLATDEERGRFLNRTLWFAYNCDKHFYKSISHCIYPDLINDLKTMKTTLDKISDVIRVFHNEVTRDKILLGDSFDEKYHSESVFEEELYKRLVEQLGKDYVRRQHSARNGNSIMNRYDIAVAVTGTKYYTLDQFVIELKFIKDSKDSFRTLYYQVEKYLEDWLNKAVIIVIMSKKKLDEIKQMKHSFSIKGCGSIIRTYDFYL